MLVNITLDVINNFFCFILIFVVLIIYNLHGIDSIFIHLAEQL
jgi:hypothetical protein